MKKEKEFEKNVLIKENEYENILSEIKKEKKYSAFEQINAYFDNNDILLDNHVVLRIRIINNEYFLQLKIKKSNVCDEYHEIISEDDFLFYKKNGLKLKDEFLSVLKKHNINENTFFYLGELKTKRIEIKEKDHIFVLDKNEYLNKKDYNVEIESISEEKANDILKDYLNKYKVKYIPICPSKSRRFISLLKGEKNG